MSEIKAKLGVDTSSVPADLAKGKAHFDKFGKEVEQSGHGHGESFGEHLVGGITKKIGAHHLSGALAAALGINIEKISEHIAAAITGGSKEGWDEAQRIVDENAALIEKKITAAMNPEQLASHLEKELAKAVDALQNFNPKKSFTQSLGLGAGELNAEQLKEQQELTKKVLETEEKLAEVKKKAAEEEKKYLEESHALVMESVDDESKLVNATVRKHEIEKKLLETGLSVEETHKLTLELLKQENTIREAGKKIEEDKAREEKKAAEEEEKAIKKQMEQEKKLGDLRMSQAEQEKKVRDDKAKLEDRSKLTIGELSQITNAKPKEKSGLDLSFGVDADLTQEQRDLKKKAQEAQEAEARVEELRKAGRVAEADDALKKLDEMKSNLVNSGFVKSTEDPAKALVEQLHLDTEKLNKTLGEIRDISKGKFVNE